MKSVRIGVVGASQIASRMCAAFRLSKRFEIVGVVSASPERGQVFAEKNQAGAAYVGVDAMLESADIDAVYVANATELHAETSIRALEAGKHVLCEKPFATTAEHGRETLAAAERSGKLFLEMLWPHALPSYQFVYQQLAADEFGAARHLESSFGLQSSPETAPRLFSGAAAGVLLDRMVYPASLALRVMGPIDRLSSEILRNENGVDVHAALLIRHRNGATSQLSASLLADLSNATTISCDRGTMEMPSMSLMAERVRVTRRVDQGAEAAAGAPSEGLKATVKSALKRSAVLRRARASMAGYRWLSYGADQYLPHLNHFADLIARGETHSTVAPHALSIATLEMLDDARQAGAASTPS